MLSVFEIFKFFVSDHLKFHFSTLDKWFCLKPGLHMVVRIAEHACDDASKRILKLSTYRLQIFFKRDQYL